MLVVPALLALGGCAGLAPPGAAESAARIVRAPLPIDGRPYAARWYLPAGEAAALVVLEHGFARRCDHLRETTRQLLAGGLMALCVDASMAAGNPVLADALARQLAGGATAPGGRTLPQRIIVGGHSAGAAFAARLGARLVALAPQRLTGLLLLDPVATAGFEADLRTVSDAGRRPLLALLADAHGCNAQLNALPALQRVREDALAAGRSSVAIIRIGEGSTHVDAEGEDSDWLGRAACGQPLPPNVARLRGMARAWAQDVAHARPPAGSGDAPPGEPID
jgi:hypothetical protein